MHLVGCFIRACHDARSLEHKVVCGVSSRPLKNVQLLCVCVEGILTTWRPCEETLLALNLM
jgi:hypothetical protein